MEYCMKCGKEIKESVPGILRGGVLIDLETYEKIGYMCPYCCKVFGKKQIKKIKRKEIEYGRNKRKT